MIPGEISIDSKKDSKRRGMLARSSRRYRERVNGEIERGENRWGRATLLDMNANFGIDILLSDDLEPRSPNERHLLLVALEDFTRSQMCGILSIHGNDKSLEQLFSQAKEKIRAEGPVKEGRRAFRVECATSSSANSSPKRIYLLKRFEGVGQ